MCDVSHKVLCHCLYRANMEGWGAPSATTATGSAVMSLQESNEACYRVSTVDQGGDCVTVVPGILCPLYKEKASPVTEYQKLLEGFSPGQYDTDN